MLSLSLLLGAGTLNATKVHAEGVNCDNNAVVYCGASSVSQLQQKYNNGDGVNKAYSIQDIYHAFGMGPSDISAMSSDAESGYVTRSGDVYVGSTLVATGAITAGRENIAGSTQHKYGATTYFERTPSVGFAAGVTQLNAMVIMKGGVFQHAIFNSCGNPVNATPVKKPTPPPTPTPTPKPTPTPTPTPKPTPTYTCVQLNGAAVDQSEMKFSFTATANVSGGAALVSADFNFGDGTSQNGVKPTGTNVITVNHTYSTANNYDISATLHFTANGQNVTAAACAANVTPTQPPTPECKPGVPVGSAMCTPCQYNASLPSNSPQCIAPVPPSLPNTGAGDTIAIFAAVAVAGFLVYRQIIFRKHRAVFVAAERGSSPLPLGDPLENTQHLHIAQVRKPRSFRRKRQY